MGTPDRRPVEAFLDRAAVFLATGFALSFLPAAVIERFAGESASASLGRRKWTGAGIIGSLLGVGTYVLFPRGDAAGLVALAAGIAAAVAVSHRAERVLGEKDDARIIADEWVGCWIAVFGLPVEPLPLLLGFVLFRFFDVFKAPWGGRRLQRFHGGVGVVVDDVAAGVLARVFAGLLLAAWPRAFS